MTYGQPFWTRNIREPTYDSFSGTAGVDVAIVGGSFAGLSAAHHLAKRGYDVAVLEAKNVGEEGGRPAGIVTVNTEYDFNERSKSDGYDKAKSIWTENVAARELVRTIAKELDCDIEERGSLHLGNNPAYLRLEGYNRVASGFDTRVMMPPEVRASGYSAALFDPSDFVIDPARYITAFAAKLAAEGVKIYENSRVTRAEPGVVATKRGSITAKNVVLAGQNVPAQFGHVTALLPIETYCIVTEPLSTARIEELGLGNRRAFWNDDIDYTYGRLAGDRLLFGGEFVLKPLAKAARKRKLDKLERKMRERFPQLDGVGVEYRWGGTVHTTTDVMPVVERHGDMFYAGAAEGIPAATMSGKIIADMIAGDGQNPYMPRNFWNLIKQRVRRPVRTLIDAAYLLGA